MTEEFPFTWVALVDWFCNTSVTAPLPIYLANSAEKNTAFGKAPIKVIRNTPQSMMMGLLEYSRVENHVFIGSSRNTSWTLWCFNAFFSKNMMVYGGDLETYFMLRHRLCHNTGCYKSRDRSCERHRMDYQILTWIKQHIPKCDASSRGLNLFHFLSSKCFYTHSHSEMIRCIWLNQ